MFKEIGKYTFYIKKKFAFKVWVGKKIMDL